MNPDGSDLLKNAQCFFNFTRGGSEEPNVSHIRTDSRESVLLLILCLLETEAES